MRIPRAVAFLRLHFSGGLFHRDNGFQPCRPAIRDTFSPAANHGIVVKTLSVTIAKQTAIRYSPGSVVAVKYETASGELEQISTNDVEQQNLSMRMGSRRLTNGFSKKLDNHRAAVGTGLFRPPVA
jgi:hypothetical protein